MKCPICNHERMNDVYSMEQVPYSVFWQDDKIIPTIDLVASMCDTCTLLFQKSAYVSNEYDAVMQKVYNAYQIMDSSIRPFPISEDSIGYALKFLSDTVDFSHIINVLEIGSNRGDFLYHLKFRFGHINIIGIEPSNLDFVGVPTVRAFFSRNIFSNKFDLVIVRHVLEHIKHPVNFLNDIKAILVEEGKLFIEVPNTRNDLMEKIEVFTPDHICYFTAQSMNRLVEESGMSLLAMRDEDGVPLMVIMSNAVTRETHNSCDNCKETRALIGEYRKSMNDTVRSVKELIDKGYRIIFYGSKNAFLRFYNAIDVSIVHTPLKEHVLAVIDDSAERIGKRVSGFSVKDFGHLNAMKDEKIVFIICAARENADTMINKIKNADLKDYKIILPWIGEVA